VADHCATPTPDVIAPPLAVAGEGGVNVRSGPSTNYRLLGLLDGGAEALVTGLYGDWWQIEYNGGVGWVFGEFVDVSQADEVPQVEAGSAPRAPSRPTPTATPGLGAAPPDRRRGLDPLSYNVFGAPGPFGVGQFIWFSFKIVNTSSQTLSYTSLGTWVQETGQFQKSWTYSTFGPSGVLNHRDHLEIPAPGTYHLFLAIQFSDGDNVLLSGPIEVRVR
jgi:hypothetical protein